MRTSEEMFDFRAMAAKVGLAKIAEKMQENHFHALLVIGGYEV